MSFRFLSCSALIVAAAFAAACSDDGKLCDPDQDFKDSVCKPKPPPVPEAGTGEADGEAVDGEVVDGEVVDGEVTDTMAPPMGMFGKVCMMSGDSAECAAPAPYCAVQPGATMGYCTATGCKANPTICPAAWTCFEISAINLNFCLKPLAP